MIAPPPHLPLPPRIKVSYPKRTTMAVGFLCSDGVVIAADRRITAGVTHTYPECKLTGLYWNNGRAILGFSGDADTRRLVDKQLSTLFAPGSTIETKEIGSLLRDAMDAALGENEEYACLFGSWCDGESRPSLLLFTSKQGGQVTDVVDIELIGAADSPLSRYFVGTIKGASHLLTTHHANLYAARMIAQSEKYDGLLVGDGIDVWTLGHRPDMGKIGVGAAGPERTKQWVEEFDIADRWSALLLDQILDKDRPVRCWPQFVERMQQFRKWASGKDDLALPEQGH